MRAISCVDLAKAKRGAPDFITIINVFLFCVDFPELQVVYASQNAGCYSFSRLKTLATDYPKFCVGMPVVRRTDGWAEGRLGGRAAGRPVYGDVLPNFLGWIVYHIFLAMVLCCESSAKIWNVPNPSKTHSKRTETAEIKETKSLTSVTMKVVLCCVTMLFSI